MNGQPGVFPLLLFACVNQPHDIPIGSQSVLRQPLRSTYLLKTIHFAFLANKVRIPFLLHHSIILFFSLLIGTDSVCFHRSIISNSFYEYEFSSLDIVT
ncbi:hypothetical protein HanHA89_Chr04g0159041 [Helianthus annuus]|nr:hypothetical protein HanHA89_Chr04g0159041 [Helianthus annuus]